MHDSTTTAAPGHLTEREISRQAFLKGGSALVVGLAGSCGPAARRRSARARRS